MLFYYLNSCIYLNNDIWSPLYAYTMQCCGRDRVISGQIYTCYQTTRRKKKHASRIQMKTATVVCIRIRIYSPAIPCYVYAVLACWAGIRYRHVLITCERFAKTALIIGAGADEQSTQSRIYYLNREMHKVTSIFFLKTYLQHFDCFCSPRFPVGWSPAV